MGSHVRQRAVVLLLATLFSWGAWAGEGTLVFSKQPIDPANPQNLTRSFQAGDSIYGLMQPQRTWRELCGDKAQHGKCYYRVCTFHQQRLLGGGFGSLELTHQGNPVPIPEENVNK